jgi:hypothetical protein
MQASVNPENIFAGNTDNDRVIDTEIKLSIKILQKKHVPLVAKKREMKIFLM